MYLLKDLLIKTIELGASDLHLIVGGNATVKCKSDAPSSIVFINKSFNKYIIIPPNVKNIFYSIILFHSSYKFNIF